MSTNYMKVVKMLTGIVGLLIMTFIGITLFLSKDDIQANFDNIDQLMQSICNENKMAGFNVALFNADSIFYSQSFGYADMEKKRAYTPETIQFVASISKTTIGLALLKAQELGYLSIDDPINKHLPFKVSNPNYPNENITIHQLATHTSSLDYNEAVVESLYISDELKTASLKSFMQHYFENGSYGPVTFSNYKPGTHWNYSNIGAALVAYIIEYSTGFTFDHFTQKYIFNPLEMNQTTWFKNKSDVRMLAKYYTASSKNALERTRENGVMLYPVRDMLTTVGDLTKYCQAIIKRDPILLSSNSFEKMLSPGLAGQVGGREADNHGVFWFIDRNQYGIFYQLTGHNGGDEGINTMMWYNPRTELGYIFIGNTSQTAFNTVHHILAMQSLASLGEHVLRSNPEHSFVEAMAYRWENLSNRVWSAVLAIAD